MAVTFDNKSIKTSEDGLMKIDGVPMFRKVIRDGVIFVQFFDKDRMRSSCRGTRLVEIRLDLLIQTIRNGDNHNG